MILQTKMVKKFLSIVIILKYHTDEFLLSQNASNLTFTLTMLMILTSEK